MCTLPMMSPPRNNSFNNDDQPPILREVIIQRDAGPGFETYPFSIPAIKSLTSFNLHPRVTFFVGENGSGKSTLLEAIAVAAGLNAEGGSKNLSFATRQTHSPLHQYLWLDKSAHWSSDGFFLRAESFYNVASEIERLGVLKYYGNRSMHAMSHGESFITLMQHRFGGSAFYLLDEPESALSPQRQLAMLRIIDNVVRQHGQFIIVTHSPILLAYPDADIWEFSERGMERIEYEQTDSYRLMRAFIERREQMIEMVLAEDEEAG